MIGVRQAEPGALQDVDAGVGQDIIDAQSRGNIGISAADAEPLFNKGVAPGAPDREIGIGVGDIVEVPADNGGIRAAVKLLPNLHGLFGAETKGIPKLFRDGHGCGEDAVIDIPDDLEIVEILAAKQYRLQMRGIDPHRISVYIDIGPDQALRRLDPVRPSIVRDQRVRDRVT